MPNSNRLTTPRASNGVEPANRPQGSTQDNDNAAPTSDISGTVPANKKVPTGLPTSTKNKPSPSNDGFAPPFSTTVIGSSNALSSKDRGISGAKKNQSSNVAVWSLKNTSSKAPESFEAVLSTNGPAPAETVFDVDNRKKVNARDFGPGGKYRSIVKLFLVYQDPSTKSPRTLIATGWLIAPDLIVTAGHCVFDWGHYLNQVVEIKAYIGYNGRASIGSPSVQFRKGVKVATTSEDLDKGEHMYECFMKVKFDVVKAKLLLEYKIDTYGGNSGAPVIRSSDGVSIGVHVMGGKINQATLIGKMGNIFAPFIQALAMSEKKMPKGPLQVSWLQMTAQPSEAGDDEAFEADLSVEAVNYDESSEAESGEQPDPSSEAYQLKQIMTRGKSFSQTFSERVSDVGLPASLGLSGKLAAIYAHAFCHSMHARNSKTKRTSTLREGAVGEADTEASSESLDPGSLGRAVLCEAALDTLFSLDKATIKRLKVWDLMAKHAIGSSPRVEGFWNYKIQGGTIGAQLATAAISSAAGALISGVSGLVKKSLDKDGANRKPGEAGEENTEDQEGGDQEGGDQSAQGGEAGINADPNEGGVLPTTTTGEPPNGNGTATDNMPKVKTSMNAFIQKLLQQSAKAGSADKRLLSLLQECAETESLAESMPKLVESVAPSKGGDDGRKPDESAEADDEAGEADEAEEDMEAAAEADKVHQGLKARLILGDAALETLVELTTTESFESVASTNTEGFWGKLWHGIKSVGKGALKAIPGVIVSAAGGVLMKKITEASEAVDNGNTDANPDGKSGSDRNSGETGGKAGNNDEAGDGDEAGNDDKAGEDPEHEAMESFEDWVKGQSKQT
ncbi:uncharacterized protein B0T23DRAFT_430148 [Neurospora hispaniola]|uniref:Serine protease n=1 Tax=Neurospora hispaniola TaxID=588809 RepID=A0AAJ0MQS7_9PEZI|nr:hypothetical protein B0T23DRAFT_430148 [Neurospora hispaniola]